MPKQRLNGYAIVSDHRIYDDLSSQKAQKCFYGGENLSNENTINS